MDKKEIFVEVISNFMNENNFDTFVSELEEEKRDAFNSFWDAFREGKSTGGITEMGQKILDFMNESKETYHNIFTAKSIAEGLFASPRSVSGSMRKLVTDGYCEKMEGSPVCYSLKS